MTPDISASVSASWTLLRRHGVARALSTASTMSDTGLVARDRVQDEPNNAATTVGTIAQYRPYSGGAPASVANATPLRQHERRRRLKPASASAFSVERSTRGHHLRSGNKALRSGVVETVEGRHGRDENRIANGINAVADAPA